jgi:hypothetical protein
MSAETNSAAMSKMRAPRGELLKLLERLAGALASRDAGRLPLAPDARFTENGQEVPPTEGIWAIATEVRPPLLQFVDSATGEAGFMTVALEHGQPVGLTARAKIAAEQIAELELIVVRAGAPLFNPEGMRGPPLLKAIEPKRRASRRELVAAANAYFDALVSGDGDSIPVTADCRRLENGTHTVLVESTAFGSSLASQGLNLFEMGVAEQINTQFFTYVINRTRDRRFVVDEEQSLVVGFAAWDEGARHTVAEVRGHGRVELRPPFNKPHTNLVSEAFQVEDGRIRAIHAIFDYFPYGMKTGW